MTAATATRVRRYPVRTISNDLYRIPEPWDLKPGLELLMVESYMNKYDPALGTRIRIDEVRRSVGSTGLTVFYHQVRPAWEGQCFVYAEDIVRLDTGRAPRSRDSDTFYWLPREFTPTES